MRTTRDGYPPQRASSAPLECRGQARCDGSGRYWAPPTLLVRDADALKADYSAARGLAAREGIMKFVAKPFALAAFVVVTAGPSYAEPLRSTSIPSSFSDDEKRLMPKPLSAAQGNLSRLRPRIVKANEGRSHRRRRAILPNSVEGLCHFCD